MLKKIHPCPAYPNLIHGADYNPEQWLHDKSIWDQDMELMVLANCNEMTVGIFSWSTLEPKEGEYDFSFLDEVIDKIYKHCGRVILGTPSGARPQWMADKYPEVLRVTPQGQRMGFSARHNHCFTSPIYRKKVRQINTLLAQRYGNHPAVIGWHISNEFSGECHCDLCKNAFRDYLRAKFEGKIENLNKAYWTTFWSHTYDSFDQIQPPGPLTEHALHGLNLDWHRFVTRQTMDFIENEVAPIREYSPQVPVTTNMMYEFYDLDYHKLSQVIDFASWDSYPEWHNGDDAVIAQKNAFWHDLYRSMKQKPFLLMESTPSAVNWKPYNKPKRPGMDTLSAIQAIAHGSDSVQYFQWRKSRGASEKFHGSVVGHDGTAHTRVFKSVQKIGRVLQEIDEIAGSVTEAKAAVIFSWENMWALDDCQGYANAGKKYFETCYAYHRQFWQRGIDCDVISPKADLSKYQIVVAPMLYLADEAVIDNLESFVQNGGYLYATYMLGTVDENDLCRLGGIPGGKLKKIFGIVSEEIDVLYPSEVQHAEFDGKRYEIVDYCEVLRPESAKTLAKYSDEWYADTPCITVNSYGKGKAYYQACRDSDHLASAIFDAVLSEIGLASLLPAPLAHGLTAHSRTDGEYTYLFVENYSRENLSVQLKEPMFNMLTREIENTAALPGYGFGIYRSIITFDQIVSNTCQE